MQLYNTRSRRKEPFTTAQPGKVSIYVCGITAYDLCHIGHARSAVVFDVLVRYLRHKGLNVTFVRNFTDVDDKIIRRANEERIESSEVARKYMAAFHEDMDRLDVLRADIEPLCTEHIPEMIELTRVLLEKGQAYTTLSGDVYFRVRTLDGYGSLSNRNLEELRGGSAIQPGEAKEDPLDFALWKAAKPGEPKWESPWSEGRPGWHLECSAMSAKYVSLPLDIHGGGLDLIFPHHENEIAQTVAGYGTDLARFWVHNGFVQIESEKMSKSLGNFFTIRDIFGKFLPEVLRFFLLTVHYRSPLDFTFESMEEAEKGLRRIYAALEEVDQALNRSKWSKSPLPEDLAAELAEHETGWKDALEDDLNTAGALGHVFSLMRLARRILDDKTLKKSEAARDALLRIREDIRELSGVLGLFGAEPAAFLEAVRDSRARRKGVDTGRVAELLEKRADARKSKDFAASDAVRDELAGMGVQVKDTPAGQQWEII